MTCLPCRHSPSCMLGHVFANCSCFAGCQSLPAGSMGAKALLICSMAEAQSEMQEDDASYCLQASRRRRARRCQRCMHSSSAASRPVPPPLNRTPLIRGTWTQGLQYPMERRMTPTTTGCPSHMRQPLKVGDPLGCFMPHDFTWHRVAAAVRCLQQQQAHCVPHTRCPENAGSPAGGPPCHELFV